MNIRFSSFSNVFNNNKVNSVAVNKFSHSNLAPLSRDTVSFKGPSELVAADMSSAPSSVSCFMAEINAEPAAYYLQKVLEHYIQPLTVKPKGKNTQKPLNATLSTRIKSKTSIREKVVSKHAKLYRKEYKAFTNSFLKELDKNFDLKNNITEDDIYSYIMQATKHDNHDTKYSPYENVPYVVDELLTMLAVNEFISTDNISSFDYKNILKSMVDNIEAGYQSGLLDEKGVYIKPSSVAGIKHYANDIVGSRIILEDSNPRYIELVFDALQRAVDDGLLKINSIENNIPDKNKLPNGTTLEDYQYASQEQLESFAKATNADLQTNITKTGYIAIHINVDLADDMFKAYNGVFNGFSGEIQIMGRDVEQLKDVEDLCYKLKDNKNAYRRVYEPFKKHFAPLYAKHKKDFDEYTYKLYLHQRATSKKRRSSIFPSAVELGFSEEQIPPQLDFNRLVIKKRDCDQDKSVQDKENQKDKESMYSLYTKGDISTMKSVIRDKIYKQAQS